MGARSPVCWYEPWATWVVVDWANREYCPFATPSRAVAEFFWANGYIEEFPRVLRREQIWPAPRPL